MFSIGDVAWWGKAKPQPWPVQITRISENGSSDVLYHCKMFGADGDVNDVEREIKERHLFHFLQNVEKYQTTLNAIIVDKISKRSTDSIESTYKRPREEGGIEDFRKELDVQLRALRTTIDEAKALMSEMRDLQVSFKASCRQYMQESLDTYRSNVERIAGVIKN